MLRDIWYTMGTVLSHVFLLIFDPFLFCWLVSLSIDVGVCFSWICCGDSGWSASDVTTYFCVWCFFLLCKQEALCVFVMWATRERNAKTFLKRARGREQFREIARCGKKKKVVYDFDEVFSNIIFLHYFWCAPELRTQARLKKGTTYTVLGQKNSSLHLNRFRFLLSTLMYNALL